MTSDSRQNGIDGTEENPRLLLNREEAANALNIGTRKLWEMTNRGEIPHVRIGTRVLYPLADIERWIAQQTASSQKGGSR
jgi:excisionase family DNA binding protein